METRDKVVWDARQQGELTRDLCHKLQGDIERAFEHTMDLASLEGNPAVLLSVAMSGAMGGVNAGAARLAGFVEAVSGKRLDRPEAVTLMLKILLDNFEASRRGEAFELRAQLQKHGVLG
jgi:hypothetical protein